MSVAGVRRMTWKLHQRKGQFRLHVPAPDIILAPRRAFLSSSLTNRTIRFRRIDAINVRGPLCEGVYYAAPR